MGHTEEWGVYGTLQMGPTSRQAYKMVSARWSENCNGTYPIMRIVMADLRTCKIVMAQNQLTLYLIKRQ